MLLIIAMLLIDKSTCLIFACSFFHYLANNCIKT